MSAPPPTSNGTVHRQVTLALLHENTVAHESHGANKISAYAILLLLS